MGICKIRYDREDERTLLREIDVNEHAGNLNLVGDGRKY